MHDLVRVVHCNDTVGSCSSRTGWTVDGLHPSKWVMLQFLSLAAQSAADVGDACGSPVPAP